MGVVDLVLVLGTVGNIYQCGLLEVPQGYCVPPFVELAKRKSLADEWSDFSN